MRNKKNLKKLLNINYADLTNKTVCAGKYDLPSIYCSLDEIPDYIALYSQPCEYHKTKSTAVSFYDYDIRFDGKKGLYHAIFYDEKKLLNEYIIRFKGVKYFICPDYSMCGDLPKYHNIFQYGRSREVALWLALNIGAKVIPNISCSSIDDLDFIFDGLENVEIIAISTKGRTDNLADINLIRRSVEEAVNRLLKLKVIIVYDTRANNNILELFAYAIDRGIQVVIPDNSLKIRHIILGDKNV